MDLTQLERLTAEINSLDDKAAELYEQSSKLRESREILISSLIIDHKLLNGTEWEFSLRADNSVSLRLTKDSDIVSIESLFEIFKSAWFELLPGIELNIDEEITLHFTENKQVVKFVKNNGMILNGSTVMSRLDRLKRDVAALENICHQFNIIL